MRLMVPPLPAASRPSNRITTRWPVALTQACSLSSSTCSAYFCFRNCAAACGGGRIDALAPVHGQLVVRIAAADRPARSLPARRGARRARHPATAPRSPRAAPPAGRGRRPGSGGRCRPARRPSPGGRRPRARRRGGAAGRRLVGRSARAGRRRGRIGAAAPARGAAPRCDGSARGALRVASAVSDSVDGVVLSVMVMVLAARRATSGEQPPATGEEKRQP